MSADNLSHVWFKVTDLEVASGEGSWVTTTSGERYLDFSGGIAVTSTGHSHPHVTAAIAAQAQRFVHAQANVYTHDLMQPLAARLAEITPEGIDTFFYANSGAEITEAAVKLAKQATGRPNIIVFQGSFHGRTHQAMAMTTSKTVYRAGHAPLPSGIFIAPYPNVRADDLHDEIARALAGFDELLTSVTAPSETAAVIIEPVLGEGGYIAAPAALPRRRRPALQGPRDAVHRRRGAVRLRPHRQDVRDRALRRVARHRLHGQGDRVRVPVLRARHPARARRSLADRIARGHLRRQPDGLRGSARDDRGPQRRRVPRRGQRSRRPARRRAASPPGAAPRARCRCAPSG